mgnify:CR=1 FL=1
MRKKLNIAVIFGGRSQEHEVSIGTALQIIEVLIKENKYNIIPIFISPNGQWHAGKEVLSAVKKLKISNFKHIPTAALSPDTDKTLYIFNSKKLYKKIHIDLAFPWVLGTFGEDWALQGLLELAGIPYVGSSVFASACGFNKLTTKNYLKAFDVPQVEYLALDRLQWSANKAALVIEKIAKNIAFPCFIKPASCGSSIGISKVKTKAEIKPAVDLAFRYDQSVIVEAAVKNAIEVECSVLGNQDPVVSTPGQVEYEGEFYDFNAKYLSEKWNVLIPPKLPNIKIEEIKKMAKQVFLVLGASGGARVDFLVDANNQQIYFNEINTVPGFRSGSMFTRLLATVGYSYSKIINTLIALALERHKDASKRQTDFSSGTDWFLKK